MDGGRLSPISDNVGGILYSWLEGSRLTICRHGEDTEGLMGVISQPPLHVIILRGVFACAMRLRGGVQSVGLGEWLCSLGRFLFGHWVTVFGGVG